MVTHRLIELEFRPCNYLSSSIHPSALTLLPVAVIVVGIVTAESSKTTQADGIGEEDLGSCVHPYLK